MFKKLLLALLLLGLLLGGVFGWKFHQIQQAVASRKPPPPPVVAVAQVREENWQPFLNAVGSLEAVEGISVSNEVAGLVSTIHFKSGQAIKKGQPLLDLDASTDRAELAGLEALRRLGQIKYERAAKLVTERSMSKADYDEARATLDTAEAAVAAKRALIDKKRVSAPFDGQLGIRAVNLGQYLPAGTAIVPLQALDPIHVDFSLPERHLADLSVGQKVEVQVQAYPNQSFAGRVTALNPGIDAGTRTLRLRATLNNPDQRLRPGMFAEVRVLLAKRGPVLTLPGTAITYNPYGDSVFLVQAGEQGSHGVQRKQIETGEIREGRVAITTGLNAGDRVVSAGQLKLRNGMAVVLDDQPAPDERTPKQ